jgi:hypothetical protein
MIHRIVLLKLKEAYATDAGRAEVIAQSRVVLPNVPGVVEVSATVPADERTRRDWDVCLRVQLEGLADVEPYLAHPQHRAFVDELLSPRLEVIKAWNFEE